jgi:hypothetical protein
MKNDDFFTLLKELPTERPLSDDEVIKNFKGQLSWASIESAESMLGACRLWLMAEWCLPADQQARCTERLMREAGYSLMTILPISKHSGARDRWQRSMIEFVRQEAIS